MNLQINRKKNLNGITVSSLKDKTSYGRQALLLHLILGA